MPYYMLTESRKGIKHKDLDYVWEMLQFFLNNDIKEWIIAAETGTFGYKHWQIRIKTRWNFKAMKEIFPNAHIEESTDLTTGYERKEGKFLSYEDTPEVLEERFGTLNDLQQAIVDLAEEQGNRSITWVEDRLGRNGKTFLTAHLYETGKAFICPPTLENPKSLIQFISSGYKHEKLIIVDIPRSWKISDHLFVVLEAIKDGIGIYDSRYTHHQRNIKGVKVLVLTNHVLTQKQINKLSLDRWDIYSVEDLREKLHKWRT